MKLYRFVLQPLGPFATNWSSSTIFGALCWMLIYRYGEEELKCFLDACLAGEPPFVLSDAFPGKLLPRPFVPQRKGHTIRNLEDMKAAKERKKASWLSLEAFNKALMGESYEVEAISTPFVKEVVFRNQISRQTGTTSEGGQLYSQIDTYLRPDDLYNPDKTLSLYAFVVEDWIERLKQLLSDLGLSGLGARASVGRGHFELVASEPYNGFVTVPNANGFISLGHMIPAANDPVQGFYKITVKRGKLGEERSHWPRVFKKPLVFFQPGSAFYDERPQRKFAGRMVSNVVPGVDDVVDCGIALVLPACLP